MEAVCVFFWSANQGLQLCVCFWCPRLFTKKNNLLFIFSFSPAEPPVLLEHFWNTTKIYLFKKRTQKKGEKEIKSCGNLDRGQSESDCLMSREGTGGWIGRWDRHWMSGLSAAVRNCPETSRVEGWVELAGGWGWWKPVSFYMTPRRRNAGPMLTNSILAKIGFGHFLLLLWIFQLPDTANYFLGGILMEETDNRPQISHNDPQNWSTTMWKNNGKK